MLSLLERGSQGVQDVPRSAWVKTETARKMANPSSVGIHTLAASVFTHAPARYILYLLYPEVGLRLRLRHLGGTGGAECTLQRVGIKPNTASKMANATSVETHSVPPVPPPPGAHLWSLHETFQHAVATPSVRWADIATRPPASVPASLAGHRPDVQSIAPKATSRVGRQSPHVSVRIRPLMSCESAY